MLILKIMSNQDYADADPRKEFRLIASVLDVQFSTATATEYEKSVLGYNSDDQFQVSYACCNVSDPAILGGKREEIYLLTGNCYVLNDRGKTIESFWARRNTDGNQVGEP